MSILGQSDNIMRVGPLGDVVNSSRNLTNTIIQVMPLKIGTEKITLNLSGISEIIIISLYCRGPPVGP